MRLASPVMARRSSSSAAWRMEAQSMSACCHIAMMDVVDLSGQAGSPAVSVPSTSAATW